MSTSGLSQQMNSNVGQLPEAQSTFVRPPFWLRALRSNAYVYSTMCKARLAYSRRILAAHERATLQQNQALFAMNEFEREHVEKLRTQGFVVLPEFFPTDQVDQIFEKADRMFKDLRINMKHAYSIQNKLRASLEGLTYEELAVSEKVIALQDPLINIPECLDIVFHPSVLRIVGNFLDFVPPLYLATLVRDFPHNRPLESSNFHKDNDEADSVQIFIYLVDIDERVGSLVYLPGTNDYDVKSCRPRLSRDLGINANDGRLSDSEVEKHYPKSGWSVIKVKRGSVAMIHGNGIHKGPAWSRPGDAANKARTAIKIDVHGPKLGINYNEKKNRMSAAEYAKLDPLQKLFAHETCV